MEYIPHKSKQKEENLQTVFVLFIKVVLYFTGGSFTMVSIGW